MGLALVILLWDIDRRLPNQVSMSIFYLIPVGLVAWFSGRRWAYAISLVAAAAWLKNDLVIVRSYPFWIIPYWNAFVRLGFFVIVAYLAALLARLRTLHDAETRTYKVAAEASELKSRMISFVSHEFGNSLTTVKMAMTYLRESDTTTIAEERTQCYETLDRVFVHLNAATSNFLNLNRLESGHFQPEYRRTLLRPLIQGVVSVLGPIIENKNIVLRLDFPVEPIPVKADPDAVTLVVSNLIGNALKYTPDGGAVTVRIVPPRGALRDVEVSVEDTGIGISHETQKHIFSTFYRTAGGKAAAKGYGVGLKVAHELLECQGVKLELQSEPNKGSRFFFRLPVFNDDDDRQFGVR